MKLTRAIACVVLGSPLVSAQGIVPWVERRTAPQTPEVIRRVGFDQHLNDQIPLDLPFRDEHGRDVQLADYFGHKPVVLMLAYYECPMLCTLSLNGMLRVFRALPFTAGKEFEAVTVSINPRETPALAAAKQVSYLEKYRRPSAVNGWHFLTGTEPSIQALAQAIGFRYYYDTKSQQYAHPTGFVILTPEGRIARYQFGVEYSERDLKLGLVEASAGKIGTPVDQLLLLCFHYDPAEGKYSAAIMNVLRAGAAATILALLAFMAVMLRRDHKVKA